MSEQQMTNKPRGSAIKLSDDTMKSVIGGNAVAAVNSAAVTTVAAKLNVAVVQVGPVFMPL